MRQIYLVKNAKTSREQCKHLNPILKEVMRVEVMKLLDAGIIYPILDSQGSIMYKLCLKSLKPQLLLMRIMSWFQLEFKLVGECT